MQHLSKRIPQSLSQGENVYKDGLTSSSAGNVHRFNFVHGIAAHRLRLCLMLICLCAIFSMPAFEAKALDVPKALVEDKLIILSPKNNSRVFNPNNILIEAQLPIVPGSVFEWWIYGIIFNLAHPSQMTSEFFIEQLDIALSGKYVGKKTIALEEGDYSITVVAYEKGTKLLKYPGWLENLMHATALFRVKRLDISMAADPRFSILEPTDGESFSGKDMDIVIGSPSAVDFDLRLERKRSDGNGIDLVWEKPCDKSDFKKTGDSTWMWTITEKVGFGNFILTADPALPTKEGTTRVEFVRKIQGLGKPVALPSLIILGSKRSYLIGEMVVFEMKGDTGKAPVVECFDNGRWGSKCPRDLVLRKMGSGAQTRYTLRASTASRYRLSVGKISSDEINVGKILGKKVADAGKQPAQVSPPTKRTPKEKKQTKPVQKKLGDTKKKTPEKLGAPAFHNLASGQKFTAGEPISFKIKSNPKYKSLKVKYELYKNACKGTPLKVSNNSNFGKLPAGRYCVRAAYLGGKKANWSKGIPFVVEEKKLKVKKMPTVKQKKMPSVKQKILKQ